MRTKIVEYRKRYVRTLAVLMVVEARAVVTARDRRERSIGIAFIVNGW